MTETPTRCLTKIQDLLRAHLDGPKAHDRYAMAELMGGIVYWAFKARGLPYPRGSGLNRDAENETIDRGKL